VGRIRNNMDSTITAAIITTIGGLVGAIIGGGATVIAARIRESHDIQKIEENTTRIPITNGDTGINQKVMEEMRSLSIRHTIGPWEKQHDGQRRRPLRIWLTTFDDSIRGGIEKVVWYLPSSFPKQVREVPRKEDKWMSIKTAAFGSFTIGAEIYFLQSGMKPMRLNRFIDVNTSSESEEPSITEN
jgi:hypothetical protein